VEPSPHLYALAGMNWQVFLRPTQIFAPAFARKNQHYFDGKSDFLAIYLIKPGERS
jgi:hypothetical protein